MRKELTGIEAGLAELVSLLADGTVATNRPVIGHALARRRWEIEHPEPAHVRHDAAS
jgi:hypothetical protein